MDIKRRKATYSTCIVEQDLGIFRFYLKCDCCKNIFVPGDILRDVSQWIYCPVCTEEGLNNE